MKRFGTRFTKSEKEIFKPLYSQYRSEYTQQQFKKIEHVSEYQYTIIYTDGSIDYIVAMTAAEAFTHKNLQKTVQAIRTIA